MTQESKLKRKEIRDQKNNFLPLYTHVHKQMRGEREENRIEGNLWDQNL